VLIKFIFVAAKEKLEIVSGAAPPPFRIFAGGIPRRLRRRNAFGLIQEYCTRKEKSKSFGSPRFARQPNCREFWVKKSVGGFELVKENFFISFVAEILMNFCFC